MKRRQLITAAAAGAASMVPCFASAYPTRPIRIISPFPPGSSSDTLARLAAPGMQKILKQPIVMETVLGAGGNIASVQLGRSPPDGYTFIMAVDNMFGANIFLSPMKDFDPIMAMTPVMAVANLGMVIVAAPTFHAQSLGNAIEISKSRRVTFSSPGVGTSAHLVGALLRERTGGDLVHVPYKGGPPALSDAAAGVVDLSIAGYAGGVGFVKSGRLRPLAVCGAQRLRALPDVPAVAELLPGLNKIAWGGLLAPRGTPREICELIGDAMTKALNERDVQAQMSELGCDPLPGGPETLAKMISMEYESAKDLVKRLNLQPS